MKLQILIPYYNDINNCLTRQLNSFQMQVGIDFNDLEVLIYNDNHNSFIDLSLFNSYNFSIRVYSEGHLGISNARNYLMHRATADYIMFCDQDDYFITPKAFELLFKYLSYNKDVIAGPIIFEWSINSNKIIEASQTGLNGTLLHGKIFKLSYINQLNLYFKSEFDGVEDYYFTAMALYSSRNIGLYRVPLYKWAYSITSISRTADWYINNYKSIIDSNNYIINSLFTNKHIDESMFCCCQLLFDLYAILNLGRSFNIHNFLNNIAQPSLRFYLIDKIKGYLNNNTLIIDLLLQKYITNTKVWFNNYCSWKKLAFTWNNFYSWVVDLLFNYLDTTSLEKIKLFPAFSIILPTHNRATSLDIVLTICKSWRYQKYELIIIDDNSIDNTEDLVKTKYKYELQTKKFKYIKLKSKKTSGVSAVRNIGLATATHNWVAYLDDDDLPLPNFLDTFAFGIIYNPEDSCFYSSWI